MKHLLAGLAILLATTTGCVQTSTKSPGPERSSGLKTSPGLEDPQGPEIVYVWPSYLPKGLVPSHATERIGLEPEPGEPLSREADYTAVWATAVAAGESRDAAIGSDDDPPRVWVNVGSTFYTQTWEQWQGERPDPGPVEDADIIDEGESLELVYREGCCYVRVGAKGLSEGELRRVAEGFEVIGPDDWSEAWGDRLLIDSDE